jgi:hypothetical protein
MNFPELTEALREGTGPRITAAMVIAFEAGDFDLFDALINEQVDAWLETLPPQENR